MVFTINMRESEVLLAAMEPYPIVRASAQWCAQLGVKEPELKGCGFEVFDADFRCLTKVLICVAVHYTCFLQPQPTPVHHTCRSFCLRAAAPRRRAAAYG